MESEEIKRSSKPAKTKKTVKKPTIDQDSCDWWTPSCKEISEQLSSLTKRDTVILRSTSLRQSIGKPMSWSRMQVHSSILQNKSSPKIPLPVSTFTRKNSTAEEDTSKLIKAKTIRLYPTQEQNKKLRQWIRGARVTYNSALRLVHEKKMKCNALLKKIVVTQRSCDSESVKKLKNSMPSDILKEAVNDLIKAKDSAWAGFKQRIKNKKKWQTKKKKLNLTGRRRWKKRNPFNLKYKPRRMTSDSFSFEAKSINFKDDTITLFQSRKKYRMTLKVKEPLLERPTTNCRISYIFGRWYLIIPEKALTTGKVPCTAKRVCGIDGGVRTFLTYFSNDNEVGELGLDMKKVIKKNIKKREALRKAVKNAISCIKKKRLQKAWYRHNARAKFLRDDLHWKCIKFLTDNFDGIIIGKLNTKRLMSDPTCKCKDELGFLSHYTFRQRLKWKATLNKVVYKEIDEGGTTQCCSRCGYKKTDVGDNKVYLCNRCGLKADRDINSGKNMLLKGTVC
jgi:transposase